MNKRHWIAGIVVLMGLHGTPLLAAPTDAELSRWTEECRALASISTHDQDRIEKVTIICLTEMYRLGADEGVTQPEAGEPQVAGR